jgi:hypothetical protein
VSPSCRCNKAVTPTKNLRRKTICETPFQAQNQEKEFFVLAISPVFGGAVETLTKYLAVAAGGAVGAILRYYTTLSGLGRTAQPFPLATFVINITGSFIIGFFLT